jgi:hypothetical protein
LGETQSFDAEPPSISYFLLIGLSIQIVEMEKKNDMQVLQ